MKKLIKITKMRKIRKSENAKINPQFNKLGLPLGVLGKIFLKKINNSVSALFQRLAL